MKLGYTGITRPLGGGSTEGGGGVEAGGEGARGKGRLPSADTNVDCLAIFPTLFLHSTNQLNQHTKNIGVNK